MNFESPYYCVKNVRIQSYSGPHFPVFGLNTEILRISPYSVRKRENTDQNNSEYGHFLRSVPCRGIYSKTLPIFILILCLRN